MLNLFQHLQMKITFKKSFVIIAGAVLFFVLSAILSVRYPYRDRMYVAQPDLKAAIIVLGTRVEDDGAPSDWLRKRVEAGVAIWEKRATEIINTCGMQEARDIGDRCDLPKLILSGDNGWKRKDEIAAMKQVPSLAQVSESSLMEDGWNARTIDSCWRAKNVLGIDHAVLITQAFHMPRALYLCNKLGVDAYGVVADDGENNVLRSYFRDWLASAKAWWDINRGYKPEHAAVVDFL
ncbi:MAG: ElyC/SanA/YdcF family protein [Patescibacteria group bacterium]